MITFVTAFRTAQGTEGWLQADYWEGREKLYTLLACYLMPDRAILWIHTPGLKRCRQSAARRLNSCPMWRISNCMAGLGLATVLETSSIPEWWALEAAKQTQACSFSPPFIALQLPDREALGAGLVGEEGFVLREFKRLGDSHWDAKRC